MKKLAIVALALVLAMTFTGCGANLLLKGSAWEEAGAWGREVWEFEADGTYIFSNYTANGVLSNQGKGVWLVEEDIVTITTETDVTKLAGVIGTYFVDLSTKDTLVLTRVVESPVQKNKFTLTRVKDAE